MPAKERVFWRVAHIETENAFSNSHVEEKNVPFPERSIQHWRVSSETYTDHMQTHKIHKIQHIKFLKPFSTHLSQHFNRYDFAPPTSSYSLVTCDSELKLYCLIVFP